MLDSADLETKLALGLLQTIIAGLILWSAVYFAVFLPFIVVRKAAAGTMVGLTTSGALVSLFLLSRCSSPDLVKRQVRRAGWVMTGVSWPVTVSYILLDGGTRSAALFVLLALTVGALLTLGQRVATVGLFVFLGLSLVLGVLEWCGVSIPQYFPDQPIAVWYVELLLTLLVAFSFMRAFTTLHRAMRQARESEEGRRAIIETAPDAVFILNAGGSIIEVNQSFVQQLGYRREEVLGTPLTNLIDPEFQQRAGDGFPEMKHPAFYESAHLRKDGTPVPLEIKTQQITFRGEPALLGIARDITERKQAEERRIQLERELQQAQRLESLGRFAGGVAHDFNNMLMVINGQSDMALLDLAADDPLRSTLEAIHTSGECAARLTRQILAFSRRQVLDPHVIDLSSVAKEMQSMLDHLMGDHVQVTLDLCARPLPVLADVHQLQQVILNLAVNARDAMPKGGCVHISTRTAARGDTGRQGPHALLAVADSGVGMDEATRQRIFDPFFTTKPAGMGTGLGLSTVQGIVTQSGGCLEVDTKPGRGTTFRIYLPLQSGEKTHQEERATGPVRSGRGTVLVVEDRPDVRQYVSRALRRFGYQVIEAADADEALKQSEGGSARFDLVLTDVVMPRMSGVDLAARLAARQPGIRVLFMSGYSDQDTPQSAIPNGADFLRKPFGARALIGKVQSMLAP